MCHRVRIQSRMYTIEYDGSFRVPVHAKYENYLHLLITRQSFTVSSLVHCPVHSQSPAARGPSVSATVERGAANVDSFSCASFAPYREIRLPQSGLSRIPLHIYMGGCTHTVKCASNLCCQPCLDE